MAEIIGRVGWKNYVSPLPTIWNNLVAYYTGDNTPNDSKGTKNLSLINGATYSTGKIGSGFSLDGVNDYLAFSSNIPYTSTSLPFSFSCWFNLTQNGTLYDNIEGGTLKGWNIWMSNGNIFVRLASGAYPTEIRTRTTNALSFNTMYHLTVSYSGNTNASGINIYINGALVSKTTQFNGCTVVALSPNSNYIGTGYFGTTRGLLDEVGIWDRALTAADVTELYNGGAGKQYVAPTPTYTTRTAAFAAATGITDATILGALNTFDTGLISNGLASKMKALYPFVGGTANTHKYNFMDARDLDVAFRGIFNGGFAHSSNGILPNGTNAYFDSLLIPSSILSNISACVGIYSRTNSDVVGRDIHASNSISPSYSLYLYSNLGGTSYSRFSTPDMAYTNSNSQGLFTIDKNANVSSKTFKNGILKQTGVIASNTLPDSSVLFCVRGLVTTLLTLVKTFQRN